MDANALTELIDALAALTPPIRAFRGWKERDALASLAAAMRFRARIGASRPPLVGLFGGSGVGKSAIFNALVGRPVSRSFWQRPTSLGVVASLPAGFPRDLALREGTEPLLLPWLARTPAGPEPSMGAPDRLTLHEHADPALARVAILDVPDFDSTTEANRALAAQLADWVDLAVFVADTERFFEGAYLEFHEACQRGGVPRLLVVNNRQGVDPLTLDEPDAREALRRYAMTAERCVILPRVLVPPAEQQAGPASRDGGPDRVMQAVLAGLRQTPAFAQLVSRLVAASPRPTAGTGGELARFRQLVGALLERCDRRRAALGRATEDLARLRTDWRGRLRDSFRLSQELENRGEASGLGVFGLQRGARTLLSKVKGDEGSEALPPAERLFREDLKAVLDGGLHDLERRVRDVILGSDLARDLELDPARDLATPAAALDGVQGDLERLAGEVRATMEDFFKKKGTSETAVRALYVATIGAWVAGGVWLAPALFIGAGAQSVLMDYLPKWGISTFHFKLRKPRQSWERLLEGRSKAVLDAHAAAMEALLVDERSAAKVAGLLKRI